jgi:hypothetical protein
MLTLPELISPTKLKGSLESRMNLLWIVAPVDGKIIFRLYPTFIYGTSSPPSAMFEILIR